MRIRSITADSTTFIVAHEQKATDNLFDMVKRYHDNNPMGRHCILNIRDSKTKAGIPFVGVTHPARIKDRTGGAQLFPELKPGGLDDKLSSSAVKAYGRYRRACDVPDGTDFHSFRRNVITVLEAAGVGQVPIARFVGTRWAPWRPTRTRQGAARNWRWRWPGRCDSARRSRPLRWRSPLDYRSSLI